MENRNNKKYLDIENEFYEVASRFCDALNIKTEDMAAVLAMVAHRTQKAISNKLYQYKKESFVRTTTNLQPIQTTIFDQKLNELEQLKEQILQLKHIELSKTSPLPVRPAIHSIEQTEEKVFRKDFPQGFLYEIVSVRLYKELEVGYYGVNEDGYTAFLPRGEIPTSEMNDYQLNNIVTAILVPSKRNVSELVLSVKQLPG